MFRRGRRRVNGRWLPVTAPFPELVEAGSNTVTSTKIGGAGVTWAGSAAYQMVPLILGNTSATTLGVTPGTLANELGGTFFHKRTVGFVDASMVQNQADDSNCFAWFGLVVDRTDQNDVPGNLGAWTYDTVAGGLKRWLYRRTWHLGNPSATGGATTKTWPFESASQYGGNASTIDCKAKARITWEEKLFAVFGCVGSSLGVPATTTVHVNFHFNLRCFGRLLAADNR